MRDAHGDVVMKDKRTYKGGKCENCGYNRCLDALEFHHSELHAKLAAFSGNARVKSGLSQGNPLF